MSLGSGMVATVEKAEGNARAIGGHDAKPWGSFTMPARRLIAVVLTVCTVIALGVSELTAALPRDRTISLHNIHTKDTVTVEYVKGGKVVPEAMEQINWVLRDWRRNEPTTMDPALIDLLWEIHSELGSQEPIHIISGFRSRATNDMLRRTVGGQASESRHILGKAADVYFPDVPLKRLRYSALLRERGGVGYYPTSATPFVHVDTDRVRHWPRLPRFELALLFPGGRSQHVPADGKPITPADVAVARVEHKDIATQLAQFHESRRETRATAVASGTKPADRAARPQLASLAPPSPQLLSPPRIVDRAPREVARPSEADRSKLMQLAALAGLSQPLHAAAIMRSDDAGRAAPPVQSLPRLASLGPGASVTDTIDSSGSWVMAPAWDEEHPEELSYRPFPLAPLLTATPSPDDPALVALVHPDVARTLELMEQADAMPPMKLRPGAQLARVMWAQQFAGDAVAIRSLRDDERGPAGQRVQTSAAH